MSTIKVLGIDLGKSSFHVIGRDHSDNQILRKKCSRSTLIQFLHQTPPCIVAFEACGGAHWLGRQCELMGHKVKLIPPQYVKPFVKSNKNDFIDADAICEASTRPNMRFVSVKSEQAQIISAIHKARHGYIKDRTACMSRIGALLLEFGMALPTGHSAMKQLFHWLAQQPQTLPALLTQELVELHAYYLLLKSIPGIGDMTASLCIANISSVTDFKSGRNMAAWLGLVPAQYSTGGNPKLLGISKRGNKELRTLFIHAARAVMSRLDKTGKIYGDWLVNLRATKPFNVVTVALANKLARIAWAVMTTKQAFNSKALAPGLQ